MDKEYLNILKSFDMRPKRIKIKELKERVLLEQEDKRIKEGEGKENINEIFVQSSEIEAMKSGPLRDIQILRLGMIAEIDASNLYEKLASLADSKDVSKLMLDISKEEKVHEGEFRSLLLKKDPEQNPAEKDGEKEVDDLLK